MLKHHFLFHLDIIISFYYVLHWAFELLMVAPLDKLKLESQAFLFKTTMFHKCLWSFEKGWQRCNHLKHMWLLISNSWIFTQAICICEASQACHVPSCTKFWALFKMNIISTLCISWRENSIIIWLPILTYMWNIFTIFFTTLNVFLVLNHSYFEGHENPIQY